mmetsp:Transcript_14873/g.38400  ORF Transcript_14873/g.38400 Transcript_14873/m.38400 type:complete len:86 (+) Transcript_14873:242-499(+)
MRRTRATTPSGAPPTGPTYLLNSLQTTRCPAAANRHLNTVQVGNLAMVVKADATQHDRKLLNEPHLLFDGSEPRIILNAMLSIER